MGRCYDQVEYTYFYKQLVRPTLIHHASSVQGNNGVMIFKFDAHNFNKVKYSKTKLCNCTAFQYKCSESHLP